jgi:hypothetical protein
MLSVRTKNATFFSRIRTLDRNRTSGGKGCCPKGRNLVTDNIPIELFVQTSLSKPPATEIMQGWRIEIKRIEELLTSSFREMGVFMIRPTHHKIIFDSIISHLKHSPEIIKLLKASQREAAMKSQSRHAG